MKDFSRVFVLIGIVLLVVALADWTGGWDWSFDPGSGVWIPLLILFFVWNGGGCGRRRCKRAEPTTI